MLGERPIDGMIRLWLNTEFEGGRHQRRLEKIQQFEQPAGQQPTGGCGG
jgi:ribose 5-phosphate isomerase B